MLNIIPEPQEIELQNGSLCICPEFKIYTSPVNISAARKFNSFLLLNYGYTLEVERIEMNNELWIAKSRPDKSNFIPMRGYKLTVSDKVQVASPDEAGIFYGIITLMQIVEDASSFLCLSIVDAPELSKRMVHWDLKGLMPDFDYLKASLEKFAYYKINAVLVEYEDKFPFEKHPVLRNKNALSRSQVKELQDIARNNFIELVPLVQCLGHAEYVLRHPEYSYVAEGDLNCQQYCPSNNKTFELFKDFASEILPLHDSEFIHIGGDEARQLGECSICSDKVKKNGKIGLYFEYIKKVCDYIVSLGKRPVIWDDMLTRNFCGNLLKKLPPETVLCCWNYDCNNPEMEYFWGPDHIRPFSRSWLKKNYDSSNAEAIRIGRLNGFSGALEKGEGACWEYFDAEDQRKFRKYLQCNDFPCSFSSFYLARQIEDAGLDYWGAGSAHCNEDGNFMPAFSKRLANLKTWTEYLINSSGTAVVATAWARGGTLKPPNAPFATWWYSFLAAAEWGWSGKRCSEKRFDEKFCFNFFGLENTKLIDALSLCSASSGKLSVFISRSISELAGDVWRNNLEFEAIETGANLMEMEHVVLSSIDFCYKYLYQLEDARIHKSTLERLNFYLARAKDALVIPLSGAEDHLRKYMPIEEVGEYLASIKAPLEFQVKNLDNAVARFSRLK